MMIDILFLLLMLFEMKQSFIMKKQIVKKKKEKKSHKNAVIPVFPYPTPFRYHIDAYQSVFPTTVSSLSNKENYEWFPFSKNSKIIFSSQNIGLIREKISYHFSLEKKQQQNNIKQSKEKKHQDLLQGPDLLHQSFQRQRK